MDDNDDLTNDATPTIRMRVDVTGLEASGITFSPTPDATLTDDAPGYKVRVFIDGNAVGFATPIRGAAGHIRGRSGQRLARRRSPRHGAGADRRSVRLASRGWCQPPRRSRR
ncbi:hypothetical protein [Nocardioides sp. B-3]|uniref:hypothetical protein n=1 Tax=Nocardioides sp. B-3 TaxID=2895565 RepID=UPI00215377DA|nr:hypothetical protein [Nocardioides sp. B-3]UUZ59123.1 hypothetical protein LP418_24805 [Nocardioides sp. B-3]